MSFKKDIDKDEVARSFLKGRKTYDEHASIQRRVSRRLVDKLAGYPDLPCGRVLEVGCCTGMLTEMLLDSLDVGTLYLNDLVDDFVVDVRRRLGAEQFARIAPIFGDIEALQLPGGLDLVVSSATFQWLADLEGFFVRIAEALREGGYLAFSIFGPGTLTEFREVTGIGLDYSAVGTILTALERSFHIEEEETVRDKLFFSSPREVLRHLQATGVGGVQRHRWTRRSLREFEQRYAERFGTASGIPVTYLSSCVVAAKKESSAGAARAARQPATAQQDKGEQP